MGNIETDTLKINAKEIHNWSDKEKADSTLPEIIQNLVITSCPELTRCDFHHGDCNGMPGLDGIVENESKHLFVPFGKSLWEISVRKDVKKKLEEDYKDRTIRTEESERHATTLVLVTGRLYASQQKWEKEKNELNEWQSVRLITAEQLAVWLNIYPSQQLHFARLIRKAAEGIATLEDAWDLWSKTTTPNIPEYFFSQEILRYKDDFIDWLQTPGKQSYTIAADSISEGLAFVRCLAQTEEAKDFRSRFIIFSSLHGAKAMLNRQQNIISVTSDESILENSSYQCENAHSILICTKNQPGINAQASLGLLDFEAVQRFSQEYGQEKGKDFFVIAEKCGYNRCIIRRDISTMVKRPQWVKQTDGHTILLGLAMLGCWDIGSKQLFEITGNKHTKEELIFKLNDISRMEDSPIWHLDAAQWYVHSKLDVLINLAPTSFTSDLLKRYYSILETEIEKNDSEQAAKHRLKQLIDTAIILAVYQSALKLPQRMIGEGTMLVTALFLESIKSNKCRANISLLPNFAELAPDQFLDWLHEAGSSTEFLTNLLSDEQACESIATSLTLIAIHEKYFSAAINHLIAFAAKAGSEKGKNRYQEAIASLIDAYFPQTNARIRERIRAFRKLSEELPAFTWNFCISQLNIHGGSYFYNQFSKWRNEGWRVPSTISMRDFHEMRHEAAEYLFNIDRWSFSQIKDMLEKLYACSVSVQEKIWKKAVSSGQFLSESDRYSLFLHNVRMLYPSVHQKEFQEDLGLAKRYLPTIAPESVKYKYIYYFSYTFTYMGDKEFDRLLATDIKVLQRFISRTPYAIREVLSSPKAHIPRISRACAGVMSKSSLGKLILELPPDLACYREFISLTLASGSKDDCKKMLLQVVRSASEEEKLAFIRLAPCQASTWEVLREELPHKQVEYWQNFPDSFVNIPKCELPTIAQKLLSVNRPEVVLTSWFNMEKDLPIIVQARLLGAYARKKRIDIYETSVSEGTIAQLLQNLHRSEGLPLKRLVYLEFSYSDNHLYEIPANSAIAKAFRESPKLVASIWKKYICPPRTDYEKKACYFVYKAYKHVIIYNEESFPKGSFITWSQEVIKEFGDNYYKEAMYCLGILLAGGAYHDINHWLHHEIMEIIEFFDCSDMEKGFEYAVAELSCRVTCRKADEGGLQERKLAFELERYVQGLNDSHFSRTISILKKIIETVKRNAEFHDRHALVTKISVH